MAAVDVAVDREAKAEVAVAVEAALLAVGVVAIGVESMA